MMDTTLNNAHEDWLEDSGVTLNKREKKKQRPVPPGFRYRLSPVRIKKMVFQGYGLGHIEGNEDEIIILRNEGYLENRQNGKRQKRRFAPLEGRNLKEKTFFISFSAPGDLLEVEINREKKGIAWGSMVRIIEPSSKRISPECPVFGKCGGCQMQHLNYQDELKFKEEVVHSFLNPLLEKWRRQGKKEPRLNGILASPSRSRYRNHIQIKSNRNSEIGFFERGRTRVVPLPESGCMLLPEKMNRFLLGLERAQIIPSFNMRVRQNFEGDVFIKKLKDLEFPLYLEDTVDDIRYQIRMDNFFQTNRFQLERWIQLILGLADLKGGERVLDLFCGGGLITLPLAKRCKEALGVEINKRSIRDAEVTAEKNGITNARFVKSDVDLALKDLGDFDLVVVDPPRSGAKREVLDWIINAKAKKLIYISCNPATFFRDADFLVTSGANLEQILPVDMFPMTYHVELVSLFNFEK